MAKGNTQNYQSFQPGRNIWKKTTRFLFLTMERMVIGMAVFVSTYLIQSTLFSYLWTWDKIAFVFLQIIWEIYLMLPATSNPNSTMLSQLISNIIKLFVGRVTYKESAIMVPLDEKF